MKWKVKKICGYAGGNSRDAMLNCEIETKSDTVNEIWKKVEATPDLLEACKIAEQWFNDFVDDLRLWENRPAADLSTIMYDAINKTKE